ncbi:MAG: hypothetical protein R2744_06345 [Bacteroidales bacterium]
MKLLKEINPSRVLFLDIETVPVAKEYGQLPENLKPFWDRKSSQISRDESTLKSCMREPAFTASSAK